MKLSLARLAKGPKIFGQLKNGPRQVCTMDLLSINKIMSVFAVVRRSVFASAGASSREVRTFEQGADSYDDNCSVHQQKHHALRSGFCVVQTDKIKGELMK